MSTAPDPISYFSRAASKLHTEWLRMTYPFYEFGKGISIHPSCEIARGDAARIAFGKYVYLAPEVWVNVEGNIDSGNPAIRLGSGCRIGRRSVISAKNQIALEDDILLAPGVLIMDHNHEYSDPALPIHAQGTTAGGKITLERNCWLGYGSVIFCGKGELRLGRNSVVGANSVVTQSFPAYSVVAGNPAKLVKRYDQDLQQWVSVKEAVRNHETAAITDLR
jgi:acetyltransferase-like isoleucine patch superfamily enzyme